MLVIRCQSLSSFRHWGEGGHTVGEALCPSLQPSMAPPTGWIPSGASHSIKAQGLPSTAIHYISLKTTYLLPGLEKLTLLPISGCFLFLKHQPLSFPSLEQLKLNFLMVLSFQTKGPLSGIFVFQSLSNNAAGKSYFLLHAETISLICFSLLL